MQPQGFPVMAPMNPFQIQMPFSGVYPQTFQSFWMTQPDPNMMNRMWMPMQNPVPYVNPQPVNPPSPPSQQTIQAQ